MKTYPINNSHGQLHAFEIDRYSVSRKRASKIVSDISEVIMTRFPKLLFSWLREDVFCEFEINSIKFQIKEPFGYHSKYWISRSDRAGYCEELLLIEKAFKNAK